MIIFSSTQPTRLKVLSVSSCMTLSLMFASSCGPERHLNPSAAVEMVPIRVEITPQPEPHAPPDNYWPSGYYCPVSGVLLGVNDKRAHGTTIFSALPTSVNLKVEECGDVGVRCVEIKHNYHVRSRNSVKILIPKSLKIVSQRLDDGFLTWARRGYGDSEMVEFVWSDTLGGDTKYGYTIRKGRLDSFWGFDFTAAQSAGLGEACYLLEGDGLLGFIDLR
jgi:hypothetical protein